MPENHDIWIEATMELLSSHRRMIDGAVMQLSDQEFFAPPTEDINSVAILLRHLGGNLHSRWTDFLTTDGEKPSRDRDAEFQNWEGDRASLIEYFDAGWQQMVNTITSLRPDDMTQCVKIRGEPHSVPRAMMRNITHIAYHTGQIVQIARAVHRGEWRWLTIPPGESRQHNESTWGTPRSRGAAGASGRSAV